MAFSQPQYDVVLLLPPAEVVIEDHDVPDTPHIGIAYVGNYLEATAGITPALVDARLSRYSVEETVARLAELRPRILGVSAMTHMVSTAHAVAERVKRELPDVFVVLGGIHATFLPERSLEEFPAFDAAVSGEGEMAFAELAVRRLEGRPLEGIPGVFLRTPEGVVGSGRGQVPEELDALGEGGWHLFDPEVMAANCRRIPVITQRGCPFGCYFCSRPYGRKVRRRTPALVVDEIEKAMARYGLTEFGLSDENFTVNKDHVTAFCNELISRNLNLVWDTTLHVNTITDDLARLLKRAGCWRVGFGVETGSERIMQTMHKSLTKRQILATRDILRRNGLNVAAFFLFGHPGETLGTMAETVRFAITVNADETAIGIIVPYPGTEIRRMALAGEGGYLPPSEDWRDYNKQLGNAVRMTTVSRRAMELGQIVGYSLVYLCNFRFAEFWRAVRKYRRLGTSILAKALGLGRLRLDKGRDTGDLGRRAAPTRPAGH